MRISAATRFSSRKLINESFYSFFWFLSLGPCSHLYYLCVLSCSKAISLFLLSYVSTLVAAMSFRTILGLVSPSERAPISAACSSVLVFSGDFAR